MSDDRLTAYPNLPLSQDVLINDTYRVVRKIADGGWSTLYAGAWTAPNAKKGGKMKLTCEKGVDVNTDEEVALKLEEQGQLEREILEGEAELYETFSGGRGIPRMRWFGEEGYFQVLVSDLLGPSIQDLFEFCDYKLSLKTVLLLADQMICRIKYIHTKGYLHMDIKPDNFLMGTGRLGNLVYIIDFGLSRKYINHHTEKHMACCEGVRLMGTLPFTTINHHLGISKCKKKIEIQKSTMRE